MLYTFVNLNVCIGLSAKFVEKGMKKWHPLIRLVREKMRGY